MLGWTLCVEVNKIVGAELGYTGYIVVGSKLFLEGLDDSTVVGVRDRAFVGAVVV